MPPTISISPLQFAKVLQTELSTIAERLGRRLSDEAQRGDVFARWCVTLLTQADGFDAEVDDALTGCSRELGIDLVLEDEANKLALYAQCHCNGYGTDVKLVPIEKIRAFLGRDSQLRDPKLLTTANHQAWELFRGYPERIKDGWSIRFVFLTTGRITEETEREFTAANERLLADGDAAIEYQFIDRARLTEKYKTAQSLEASIPERVDIDLPADRFFVSRGSKCKMLVAVLKGTALVGVYRRYGSREALFAHNIRNYLGDRGINKDIKSTAQEAPEHFVYYNNGVTAVCRDFDIEGGNHLSATKLQIINGAQTIASLDKAPNVAGVEVMFRLIATGKTDSDAGINHQIIQANNTQNAVKLSDFRSNDPVQLELERGLRNLGPIAVFGNKPIVYKRKRSIRSPSGVVVGLEDMGKVRYAWHYDPLRVQAAPKQLWTMKSSEDPEGAYAEAFGINGQIEDKWDSKDLWDTAAALAVYARIGDVVNAMIATDPEDRMLRRLRFHILALVGRAWRKDSAHSNAKTLLSREDEWSGWCEPIVKRAVRAVKMAKKHAVDSGAGRGGGDGTPTLWAFVRNPKAWDFMVDQMSVWDELPKL